MTAADHALPGGRHAAEGLCQACAQPWPCPTERIRASLERMDEPAWTRDPEPLTVDEEAAAIVEEHRYMFGGGCAAAECAWNESYPSDDGPTGHAAHLVALLRAAGCLADDAPVLLLTPAPGVRLTRDQEDEIARLGRATLGTSTGAGGVPGGAG